MADGRSDEQRAKSAVDGSTGAACSPPTSRQRRPYRAPRLRHLGSVRELTWGDVGAYADGIASQATP
jgi:hypothetical protein